MDGLFAERKNIFAHFITLHYNLSQTYQLAIKIVVIGWKISI